jgi:hypothetical protein
MNISVEQRTTNPMTAAILARLICPDRADWSAEAAQGLLKLRFIPEDLDRFHQLLATQYGEQLTASEQKQLDSYMFVNCILTLIHDRARRSLNPDPINQTPNPTS